ncbi:MAG: peptide transporter ptr2 [Vezdaea aestivalis]|nr:MAG: peptide transporter ptr2 [Vezdaea aestivalis]
MDAAKAESDKGSHEDSVGGAELPHYSDEKNVITLESSNSTLDGGEPTEEESRTLRKVSDKLPWSMFLVAIVELCERFASYGVSGPFQNYIQNSKNDPKLPGAIGLGQTGATGLVNFFQFFCYITPLLGGFIADQYLGRYYTILYGAVVYVIGLLILFATALPTAIDNNASLGGLIAAMIVIGLGTGAIKSNVSTLIAEQIQNTNAVIRTLKSGERVIVDPAITVQRVYMIFYLCINIGSLSAIATTELELHVGFWAAYLLPMCMFIIGFFVLIVGKNKYVSRPPQGSVMPQAIKVCWIGLKNRGNIDVAKPSHQPGATVPWDDHFVDEIKRALIACKIFVYFPIYWVVYSQMLTNFISQAGTMELHGIPNDIMQNIDPLTIIIFIPIMDRVVYPFLRKMGILMRPITRITFGFFFASLAMAYAAIVQKLIYRSPPCYSFPSSDACESGGNKVHVAVQTPAYLLIGLSEIFASITGLEYAFTKAPTSMKSFVMALFLLTTAFGSALAIALSPTAKDPKLLWMYTGLAVAAFLAGCLFWFLFSKYNKTEEQMNALDKEGVAAVAATEFDPIGRRKSETNV